MAEWATRGDGRAEPQDAATVVLVRDVEGELETLMLRRNSKIAFGGMWVFPGGRVDPEDRTDLAGQDEVGAARRAAVREAAEEAGLVVAADSLVPFSHWTPPPVSPRRYLTWFFLAPAPTGAVSIDGGEIHEHQWMSPRAALEEQRRQRIELAPPTFVTLTRLASFAGVEAALAAFRAASPERFATRIARAEGGMVALWHGDAGYDEGRADAPGDRHRLWMLDDGWRYERTT